MRLTFDSSVCTSNDMVKKFTAPERTFTRGQGCWNCKSYENGNLAKQHWQVHMAARLNDLRTAAPMSLLGDMEHPEGVLPSRQDPRRKQLRQMGKAIEVGVVGMCMKGARPDSMGGPSGDFVEHRFLCDRWDGVTGASVARAGGAQDKLPDELKIDAEERARKNS